VTLQLVNSQPVLPSSCQSERHHLRFSTLNEMEGQDASISICEILFSIQQLLAHENAKSPAHKEAWDCYMSSVPAYNEKAKEQAQKWSPNALLDLMKNQILYVSICVP